MSDSESISVEKLKSLIELSTRINSSYADYQSLLVNILESVMSMVKCESSSLLLIDRGDDSLHFAIALGPKGPEVLKIPVSSNSIAGWVVKNNKSIIVNDVLNDSRFYDEVQKKTNYITKNMIAFPMHVNGVCIGVIELINKANGSDFNQFDLDILELMGDQAGIAYQNAYDYKDARDRIVTLQNAANYGKEYHTFVAKSPAVLDMLQVIEDVAQTSSSVLIIGESGVGKELFAEQIHLKSPRKDKPFIRVSCAALSPSLLESELFGHVKGAYTNATTEEKGRFESADGGTLFLDEIGEMPLNLQSKLLRALQTKQFERVGSSKTIKVDVRIVAATNRNLEDMVKEGTFRGDLYYRLNVLPLNIPPLRERKEDIAPLAEYFRTKFGADTKKYFEGFSEAAKTALMSYYWPGNVRELENTIERACILGKPPLIQVGDLRLPHFEENKVQNAGAVQETEEVAEVKDVRSNIKEENLLSGDSSENIVGQAISDLNEYVTDDDRSLKNAVNCFKKKYVTMVLQECSWNQTAAAKILDVQRTYVSKLIAELQIKK